MMTTYRRYLDIFPIRPSTKLASSLIEGIKKYVVMQPEPILDIPFHNIHLLPLEEHMIGT
jgi:hypothetical protein